MVRGRPTCWGDRVDDYILRPVAALKAEGWNGRQLRAAVDKGALTRPAWGFYGSGKELTGTAAHLVRAEAILKRHGKSVVLSHVTAAILHGLSVEVDDPGDVHLTVAPPARGRRRAGYHVHVAPLEKADVTELRGLRVTSLARTAADLARGVPFEWGVVAMDQALRRGVTQKQLEALLEGASKRAGVETLRRVVAFADGRAESAAESVSRVTMARAGMPAPLLQYQVTDESGWVADGDFGWPELGVVGEVDGEEKYKKQVEKGQSVGKVVRNQQDRDESIRQAGSWPTHWGWKIAWDVHRLGEQLRGAFRSAAEWRTKR